MTNYRRVAQIRSSDELYAYLREIDVDLPFDNQMLLGSASPIAQSCTVQDMTIGNRFAVLPMEGWDGTTDGHPTELVRRRWQHFGESGAKLIWGGEAVAVAPDARANPNQLMINDATVGDIAALREHLVATHRARFGNTDDLVIGLQLTHSGRFARPYNKQRLESKILYHHPILDKRFGIPSDLPVLTDDEIAQIVDKMICAARLAQKAGFHFVDIKHCHGYLGHEMLSAVDRPGRYGGCLENRTRFLREIVAGIRAEAPALQIGVRLSAFDWVPFHMGVEGIGEPVPFDGPAYPYAFGGDGTGMGIDLTEPYAFMDLLLSLDIRLVCVTAGTPYYNPHLQRPALFAPSDGYRPPEDPLAGVARQIRVVNQLKQHRPELVFVGSGYSYLQEWLPNVAQRVIRTGMADFVGLGRLMLCYSDIVADILAGKPLQRKRLCRTFSDCTTAPRNGLVSGCYPLDDLYKERPEAETLAEIKQQMKLRLL
jgi:NADPH2 dehydrogenase